MYGHATALVTTLHMDPDVLHIRLGRVYNRFNRSTIEFRYQFTFKITFSFDRKSIFE